MQARWIIEIEQNYKDGLLCLELACDANEPNALFYFGYLQMKQLIEFDEEQKQKAGAHLFKAMQLNQQDAKFLEFVLCKKAHGSDFPNDILIENAARGHAWSREFMRLYLPNENCVWVKKDNKFDLLKSTPDNFTLLGIENK